MPLGTANLAAREAPKFEDNETTFEQLRARIAKTLAYLDTFSAKDFERTSPAMRIPVPNRPGKVLPADEYLLGRQLPNFCFHLTTAYDRWSEPNASSRDGPRAPLDVLARHFCVRAEHPPWRLLVRCK